MIDLDRELRALLEEDARHAPPTPEPRAAIRRARRRQVGMVLTTLAMVAAVAVGSIAGVSALVRSSERRIPIGPAETPTPSSASPAPVVISGDGLRGYTEATFPRGVEDLAVAPDGTLWAVSRGLVARLDGDAWTTFGTEAVRLGSVWTIEVAADGTVWTSGEEGVARLDGDAWTIVSRRPGVRALAVTPWGSVVAGWDDRVARFEEGSWTTLGDLHMLLEWGEGWESLSALDVSPVDGRVWVGTGFWGGIERISRYEWEAGWGFWEGWIAPEGLLGSNMGAAAMTVALDGTVWVMLGGTLARPAYGGEWDLFQLPVPVEADYPANSMAVGPDGAIWIARSDGVLLSFDGTSWTKDRWTEDRLGGHWTTIEVAGDGTLWVGTDDSLVRFTPTAE